MDINKTMTPVTPGIVPNSQHRRFMFPRASQGGALRQKPLDLYKFRDKGVFARGNRLENVIDTRLENGGSVEVVRGQPVEKGGWGVVETDNGATVGNFDTPFMKNVHTENGVGIVGHHQCSKLLFEKRVEVLHNGAATLLLWKGAGKRTRILFQAFTKVVELPVAACLEGPDGLLYLPVGSFGGNVLLVRRTRLEIGGKSF